MKFWLWHKFHPWRDCCKQTITIRGWYLWRHSKYQIESGKSWANIVRLTLKKFYILENRKTGIALSVQCQHGHFTKIIGFFIVKKLSAANEFFYEMNWIAKFEYVAVKTLDIFVKWKNIPIGKHNLFLKFIFILFLTFFFIFFNSYC